ncbi:MAG: DNA polymerase III subunit alpha, partial [Thermoguttaceae bacterium]|nr:DNA polymerase III subunit alpha [Thermoguttaceae bacterium]
VEHIEDCQRMKIEVVPPDVNRSHPEFAVEEGKILYGLTAVKGCGRPAAEAILEERRRGGPFRNLFDFCERLDPHVVNRTSIESLVKAGALDCFHARRSQLFQTIDRAMQSGAAAAADRRSGQKGLFGDDDEEEATAVVAAQLPDVPEWDERDKLAKEKEVLGFYLSSHPLAEHAGTLATYCSHTTVEAAALPHQTEVMLGGMLAAIKIAHTKNPKPGAPSKYAMWDLEDMEGIMRCILWPEPYVEYGHLVQADAVLVALGRIDKRPGSEEANFIVNELIPLGELQARYTRGVAIRISEAEHGLHGLEQLYEILRGYPGPGELQLVCYLADGRRVSMTSDRFRVDINPEMRSRVEELLGPGNLRLLAAPRKNGHSRNGNGRGGNGNGRHAGGRRAS